MAGEIITEIVRDRCGQCGQPREVIFDFQRAQNTVLVSSECWAPNICANQMVAEYLQPAPGVFSRTAEAKR